MNKIALAAAILCCSGSTLAQKAVNPSWYVQPSVVGLKDDSDFGVDKRGWGGGLKFGKAVSPMWDIQFGATYARAHQGQASYHQALPGVDALLMLSRETFRPFLLIGVGAANDGVKNPIRNVSETSPYLAAGLGFQLGLTDQWSMQADIRSVHGRMHDKSDFGFDRSSNKYLTVGFNYAFDKPYVAPAPAPAPVSAPAPAPVAEPVVETPAPAPAPVAPPPARFEKVSLSATELFAFNGAKLSMPQPKLDEIAAAMSANESITEVTVAGYTDRIGSPKYNLKLAQKRAEAVREYIIGKGIDGGRIKAAGKGAADPVAVCNNKKRADLIKCLEPNRRVEVGQFTVERKVQ
jgi:OOP family OmpA-OmpF porin